MLGAPLDDHPRGRGHRGEQDEREWTAEVERPAQSANPLRHDHPRIRSAEIEDAQLPILGIAVIEGA